MPRSARKRDRPLGVLLVEPRPVAELDRGLPAVEPLDGLLDRRPVLGRRVHPARVLEEDRAELAALGERGEPLPEHRPDRVLELGRQVLGVDPRLRPQVVGQLVADRLRQPLRLGPLPGHQRVGLDVEREVGRRAVDPQLGGPGRRQRVVGRVDLDDRERLGVVVEPLLGRVGAGRVEHAGRGHRRVGPRGGADPDRCRRRGPRSARRRRLDVGGARARGRRRRDRAGRSCRQRTAGEASARGSLVARVLRIDRRMIMTPSRHVTRVCSSRCAPPASCRSCSSSRPAAG